jgi:hypothetical protein
MERNSRINLPDLARDLVYMDLRQTNARKVTLDSILDAHDVTTGQVAELLGDGRFKKLLTEEQARARTLGARAGFVFRLEDILTLLAETLSARLNSPDEALSDVISGFKALARAAGLEALPETKAAVSSNVNVQINIPRLVNPKLRHLEDSSDGV